MGLFENHCDISELEYEQLLEVVGLHQLILKERDRQFEVIFLHDGLILSTGP